MRVLLIMVLVLCVCYIHSSKSSAQVDSSAQGDVVAEWHFAPIYTLAGYARSAPGLQDLLKPAPPAALARPDAPGQEVAGSSPVVPISQAAL